MKQFDITSIPSQDWMWHPNDTDSHSPIVRMYPTKDDQPWGEMKASNEEQALGFSNEALWRGEVFTHMLDSGFYYKVCAMDHKMLGMGDTNYRYYISPVEYMHTVTIQGGQDRGRNQMVEFQCEECLIDHNVYEALVFFSQNCTEELVPYAKLNMSSPTLRANKAYEVRTIDFSTTM